ncbi:hypothetical protein UP09_05470 [Bradyrhizobium sp. LTSP885]|nr:hypothetical protein UP09_05470 [Bradyrhizobium sp. LTSP885]
MEEPQEAFDYVVIGAGSSGCVVANRLSASPSISVLLLEAGIGDSSPWIGMPGGIFKVMHNPDLNWNFETGVEGQLNGRRLRFPRGKTLGGSSSINGMVYVRGQREDFDDWRQKGLAGWSYENVLPYFCRSEDNRDHHDAYHGRGGPLCISRAAYSLPIVDDFVAAAVEAGLPKNDDFNGEAQEGAGYFQSTIRNGLRASSSAAFLRPVRHRKNLVVRTKALIDRVVMVDGKAAAVRYLHGTLARTARCRREIILCAGVVGSPEILQRSGVGDRVRLEGMGIKSIVHSPEVGENLQDHFQARLVFRTKDPITLNDRTRGTLRKLGIGMEFALFRTGVLASGVSPAGVFAKTLRDLATPDVQIHFQPLSLDSYDSGLHPFSGVTLSVCQLRPSSRGRIHVTSPDPRSRPDIEGNYLASWLDQTTMVHAVRLARQIAESPRLSRHISAEWAPGAELQTDEQILEYIRSTGTSIYHPVGTCRMGIDPASVVDGELKVRGVRGLRVADCSIMPSIVSGNTNAAAIMIGEKASDIIKMSLTSPV